LWWVDVTQEFKSQNFGKRTECTLFVFFIFIFIFFVLFKQQQQKTDRPFMMPNLEIM